MVVGRPLPDGSVEILDDAHAIARMGKGVDEHRRVLPETIERVCRFLDDYRQRAGTHGVARLRAFGTSALRDAANADEVIAAARERAGVELVEVSGGDEARLTFAGAAFGLDLPPRYAVIDIGGGSTEVAAGDLGGDVDRSASVDVGAVRVTERYFPGLPPTGAQVDDAIRMIDVTLQGLPTLDTETALVGVAGTVTTLGALDCEAPRFDDPAINGHTLTIDAVRSIADRLCSLSMQEIQQVPQISDQRADIITAGALILRRYLETTNRTELTVSTRGIRYGLLLEMLAGRR